MCMGGYSGKEDPAVTLAALLNDYATPWPSRSAFIRAAIRNHWKELCALAHQIHDEETSEERKMIQAVEHLSQLDKEGFLNVVKGTAHSSYIDDFKLLARKVLDVK